ncbi:MAG: hypothetical protein U0228_32855 [Myxococcaceae bacterium]
MEWQVEVEAFVQLSLYDWAFDPLAAPQDPRLLLLIERASKALIGVAAHERAILLAGRRRFAATKLEVVAVSSAWQGRRTRDGRRASDLLLSGLMLDVSTRVPPRDARVFAVVHEDNFRSIALLQRHGLTQELSRPAELSSYRRLVTAHKK